MNTTPPTPRPATTRADDPSDWRLALATLQAEAEHFGQESLAHAFRRLGLLTEVGDCLAGSLPAESECVAAFCAEAYDRLTRADEGDPAADVAAWVIQDSDERWGDYLTLIDSGFRSTQVESTFPTSGASGPDDDAPSAIDSGTLFRLLTGDAPLPAADDTGPATDPFHLIGFPRDPVSSPSEFTPDDPTEGPDDELAPPSGLTIDPELRDTFLAEADDLFERIETRVLELGQVGSHDEALHELGRCFHTLKGAAGSVDLTQLVVVVHETESQLEGAGGVASGPLVDRLHKTLRYIEGVFVALRRGGASPGVERAANFPGTQVKLARPPTAGAPASETSRSVTADQFRAVPFPSPAPTPTPAPHQGNEGPVRVSAERVDELMDLASELITRRGLWVAQAESMKDFESLARTCRSRMLGTIDRLRDLRHEQAPQAVGPSGRVAFQRADELPVLTRRLVEQSEDLVVLAESAQSAAKPLADNADALARLTLQLWEALQAIRIVPVRGLFQRLTRVAHEAARVEGRQVEVVTVGEDIGLDRAAQDKAFEPLLHVVRNAVSHGIESAEGRARAGKPPAGRVTLQAARAGPTLTLSVSDDGRGIDYEAVAAKGRRLGLLGPDDRPGVDRLNALIFQPGFSTREEANAIAGRGVGMDVVSQEAARLHGTVALASQKGQGTRLSLSFPARLALEQSMVLRVDGRAFALPVELTEQAQPFDADEVDWSGPCPSVLLREQRVPLIALREVLGVPPGAAVSCPKVLLTRAEGERLAVLVDTIDGTRELVIKPLGALLAGHPMVSGTSLSVNGEVVFALNPAGLARWYREGFGAGGVTASLVAASRPAPVLVVDDSISVRKVVVKQLRADGYEVDEASDGLEALGKIRNNVYSLVVSDLEMPRMDGFELLAELSRLTIAESVPVVIASSKSDPETRRRVLALGAREFLPKPIVPEELRARLRVHASRPGRTAEPAGRPDR